MNPYETSTAPTTAGKLRLNDFGIHLRLLGYFLLIPAIMFAALILCGTLAYSFSDNFTIPFRIRWSLAMSVSLVVFLFASSMMARTYARLGMYAAGAATIFSAIVYDAFIAAELDAYSGNCGNPVMAGLMFRVACFSTYAGVPIIAIAALICLRRQSPAVRYDEP